MSAKPSSSKKAVRPSPTLPSVTLIGYGNWGTALAHELDVVGVPLCEIIVRSKRGSSSRLGRRFAGARLTTMAGAALTADVLWICTPDAAIAHVADQLASALVHTARHKPPIVFHSSGALASTELSALQTIGASVASVHPLMTFPKRSLSRAGQPRQLVHVPFAIEGDLRACHAAGKLVSAVGGETFTLSTKNKPLYHAFGAFASPLLAALLTAAMETGVAAGFTPEQARRRMRPIVERTVLNFFTNGPDKSFSGPIARGDAATVARHLKDLRSHPRLLSTYRELTRFALDSLPAQNKKQIQEVLNTLPDKFRNQPGK
jgi:predicted short-subunit dehydrogenase-like oxidoreductase (DUF2520 family)